MSSAISANVALVLKDMSNEEILAQRLTLLLGGEHKDRYGYDKIKPLLTQENETKMHGATADAFLALSGKRLGI